MNSFPLSQFDENKSKEFGLFIDLDYVQKIISLNNEMVKSHPIFQREKPQNGRYHRGSLILYLNMYENSTLLAHSPFDGKVVKAVNGKLGRTLRPMTAFTFYQFFTENEKKFYLIIGEVFHLPLGIYIPNYEDRKRDVLIIFSEKIYNTHLADIQNAIRKDLFNTCDFNNLDARMEGGVLPVMGVNKNFGHSLWNDTSGLFLSITHDFGATSKAFYGPYSLFQKSDDFFKFDDSVYFDDIIELFTEIDKLDCLPVRPVDFSLSDELLGKINELPSTSSLVRDISSKAKSDYIFLIHLSNDKWGTWESEIKNTVYLVEKLSKKFNNLTVVFDGLTKLSGNFSENNLKDIDKVHERVERFSKDLPEEVSVYNINALCLADKVAVYSNIDSYFARLGSPLTFPCWIADKPGVAYGPKVVVQKEFFKLYSKDFFPHMRQSVDYVPLELIVENKKNKSYDFNIEWCLEKIIAHFDRRNSK